MALVAWSIAPWVGYWALLVLVGIAQAFALPSFSIVRQAVMAAVDEQDRRTAIALDSSAMEVSYIVAPAVAIAAAAHWSTSWVILWVQMLGVAGGIVLAVVNPRLKGAGEVEDGVPPAPRRTWLRMPFVGVLAAAAAATLVLSGSDLAIVASVRALGSASAIGVILALWGLGSLVGGLLYGALHRSITAYWLLAALGAVTLPLALVTSMAGLGAFAFVAGLLCAPTITATIDQAARIVPAASRGEAMGWHGSALTAGGAIGAPLAGFAIDQVGGPGAGFTAVALAGLTVAVARPHGDEDGPSRGAGCRSRHPRVRRRTSEALRARSAPCAQAVERGCDGCAPGGRLRGERPPCRPAACPAAIYRAFGCGDRAGLRRAPGIRPPEG